MTTIRLLRLATLVLLAVLATGCSGAIPDQGSDGAGKLPRPYQPYTDCMRNDGIDLSRRVSGPTTDTAKAKNAGKVCRAKLPLPAWEVDANTSDALDFGRKVVQCLKGKGVKYVELSTSDDDGIVGPSFGGKNNDQESISTGLDLSPECEREVAGR